MSSETASPEAPTFESHLVELEHLVETMEAGELPLEQLVTRYGQGMALLKKCEAHLTAAELRIEELQPGREGPVES